MKFITALLTLLVSVPGFAQSSLLWKIEGKDIKKPSYIFGTIHLIPASDYFEPAGLEAAFQQSELLVGEMDLSDMNGMTMEMLSDMYMKGDTTLDMLLTKEEYDKLDQKFIESMGVGLDFMKSFKPIFLSTMLMTPGEGEETKSYEMELLNKANSRGMKMAGLETLQEQMGFLDVMPYSFQAKELVKMIDKKSDDSDFRKLIDAYKSQNLDALVKIIKEQSEGSVIEDVLLGKRNKNWIQKIVNFAKSQPSFIAVGAGHLGGQEGIIKLLQAEGYKLTPVTK